MKSTYVSKRCTPACVEIRLPIDLDSKAIMPERIGLFYILGQAVRVSEEFAAGFVKLPKYYADHFKPNSSILIDFPPVTVSSNLERLRIFNLEDIRGFRVTGNAPLKFLINQDISFDFQRDSVRSLVQSYLKGVRAISGNGLDQQRDWEDLETEIRAYRLDKKGLLEKAKGKFTAQEYKSHAHANAKSKVEELIQYFDR